MDHVQTAENQAAWLPASKVTPLEVCSSHYVAPGPGQLLVKNSAVGVNFIDRAKQMLGEVILGHVSYPAILGEDIAGTVVGVGEGVTRFNVGDRVLSVAAAITCNNPAEGGFQLYTLAREWLAVPLPDHITFEQACVLPLPVLTASLGIFGPDYLGLDLPIVPTRETPTTADGTPSRVIIITGGASAVGGNAIQMARSAGYEVVSTASPKNFDHVKKLGAAHVVDYNNPTVTEELLAAIRGRKLCGCLSIGDGTSDVLAAVLLKHEGPANTCMRIARAEGKHSVESDSGVDVRFILIGPHIIGSESPLRPIFEEYLPQALSERAFVPWPAPEVVGHGLNKIQSAFAIHQQGISAKKIVVTL